MTMTEETPIASPYDYIKRLVAETLVGEFAKNPLIVMTGNGHVKNRIIDDLKVKIGQYYPCRLIIVEGQRISVSLDINCCVQTYSYSISDMQEAMDMRAYIRTGSWVRTVSLKKHLGA